MFVYFAIFLLIGLALIFKFKSIFLKFILLVYWYPLITMYMFCLNIPLGGSLDVIGRPSHEVICERAFILALLGFFTLVLTLWKIRREVFSIKRFKINEISRVILAVILFGISVLAFPRAFGIGEVRWNLIPGPWAVVFISLNAVLILSFNGIKRWSTIIQIVILMISIIGGERANSMLVIVMLFLIHYSKKEELIIERKLNLKLAIFFLGFIALAISAGVWRSGRVVSLVYVAYNFLSVHTVKDVVHIYFSSFSYINEHGLNFYPILNEIGSLLYLPILGGTGVNIVYNFTEILRAYMYNLGGGLFYTEGVLIFGSIGVIIYAILYGVLIRFLYKYKNIVFSSLFIVFIILQMRIQWYGFMYIYMPIWFTILIIEYLRITLVKK